jgi:hypothetical protein
MGLPESYEQLVTHARKASLYRALIAQLNKDLMLANVDRVFATDLDPESLKKQLQALVEELMLSDFSRYLNLLYVMDVSEAKMRSLQEVRPERLSPEVSFLMLQRVWQKVWLKQQLG